VSLGKIVIIESRRDRILGGRERKSIIKFIYQFDVKLDYFEKNLV
jgi:hypothetical protein